MEKSTEMIKQHNQQQQKQKKLKHLASTLKS